MPKLSVVLPSRNERFLNRTIQDVFEKAKGDTEVVVCLDGYWPEDWKEVTAKYPNLHTVHNGSPQGMRSGINKCVASAKSRGAKYVMKLDAHCMLDEGFDVKLLADIEPNWVVIPRRKRLDAENWTLTDTQKLDIDYHYLSFPDDPKDFGGPGLNGKVWEQRAKERRDKPEYEIDDEMASQGSCWLTAIDYFYELELMDEANYGPFWNESQEVLCKAWLSGGRGVINKKTWYAHLHKGKKYGRGYHLDENWLKQGATFTKKWLFNEAWAKQTLPFNTLIERFWPVPSWPENWEELVYGSRGVSNNFRSFDRSVSAGVGDSVTTTSAGLTIHTAHYGTGDTDYLDVTQRIQSLVKDNCLDIGISNAVIVPNENPWRGQKKRLKVTYSYDGGEPVTVVRDERDALIIGQMPKSKVEATLVTELHTPKSVTASMPPTPKGPSGNAVALNDLLIRKFNIPDRRLRGPMPIEISTFHRDDLAKLFAELGFNKGAEIGVAEGHYSETLLKANPNCELLLVDPWHRYSGNPQSKSKEKDEFAYRETLRKIEPYPNAKTDARLSMEAVVDVPENSLDFVYIDGHHGFDYVMQDLIEWSKRVRSGGIIAGDDYFFINAARWGAGVVEAVQSYTSAHKINPWFVIAAPRSVDYFWVKP